MADPLKLNAEIIKTTTEFDNGDVLVEGKMRIHVTDELLARINAGETILFEADENGVFVEVENE